MPSVTRASPGGKLRLLHALIAGLQGLDPNEIIKVRGKTMTVAEHIVALEADVAVYQAVIDTDKANKVALQTRDAAEPAINKRCSGIIAALKVVLGPDNPALADFGIKPAKPRQPLSPAEQLAATEKAAATRKARHTMGPKQKAAITGSTPPPPTGSTTTTP